MKIALKRQTVRKRGYSPDYSEKSTENITTFQTYMFIFNSIFHLFF